MSKSRPAMLDVERAAVQRLLGDARHEASTIDASDVEYLYWDGYCRALEHVLEMENE